jgi:hypothetical protein
VLVGVVVGLGLTNLLKGFAGIIEHPRQKPVYWVHLAWALFMFIYLIHFWWWEFRYAETARWTFLTFMFIVVFALLLFLLSSLVFPESMSGHANYCDYFYTRRAWFFGLLAATFVIDLYDTWLKGADYFHRLGTEYLLRNSLFAALCIVAVFTRDRKFHGAYVTAALVYQASWILRMYNVLA